MAKFYHHFSVSSLSLALSSIKSLCSLKREIILVIVNLPKIMENIPSCPLSKCGFGEKLMRGTLGINQDSF